MLPIKWIQQRLNSEHTSSLTEESMLRPLSKGLGIWGGASLELVKLCNLVFAYVGESQKNYIITPSPSQSVPAVVHHLKRLILYSEMRPLLRNVFVLISIQLFVSCLTSQFTMSKCKNITKYSRCLTFVFVDWEVRQWNQALGMQYLTNKNDLLV